MSESIDIKFVRVNNKHSRVCPGHQKIVLDKYWQLCLNSNSFNNRKESEGSTMMEKNVQLAAYIRDDYNVNRMMLITSMEIGAIRRRCCSKGLPNARPDVRPGF